jgi:hypothetical protein
MRNNDAFAMADLILEPYAVRQAWSASEADVSWGMLIGEYLQTVARHSVEGGTCVIGHIKALALFPDHTYLRASVVSPDRPATFEGIVPEGVTEFVLSVNVIVYGLDRDSVQRIAREAASGLEGKRKGGVRITEI